MDAARWIPALALITLTAVTSLVAQESAPVSRRLGVGESRANDRGSDSVKYTFTLIPGPPVAVRVTLQVRGEMNGTSRLSAAPSWAYVQDCEKFVRGLRVRDGAGRECRIGANREDPHGWNVEHEPGSMLTAEYELRPLDHDPLAGLGTHFEPVVRDDLFHLIGETGLIYPEWLERVGPVPIDVAWSGFKERNWKTVSPFDPEEGRTRQPPQAFRHAIFLAGRIRIHDRAIRGGNLRVAIHGEDWELKDSELVDLIERVITLERQFVNDFSVPDFLVTVVPTGPRATQRSMSLGGTAMTRCFALFLPPGTDLRLDSVHRIQLLRLLAHEYFHIYNGQKIAFGPPELDGSWFSEGFTEFYSARLLRRAGLIDDAEWLKGLNEVLKAHWLSQFATVSAEIVRRDSWKRPEVGGRVMHRGIVAAHILDEEIRKVSGGKRSVDDFFLELLAASGKGTTWDTPRILTRVAQWTNPECVAKIRGMVVDGSLPDPPSFLMEPAAERADEDSFRFDPGFELDSSLAANVATGVVEGGPAYAAGLRDGQAISDLSCSRDNPDREIRVTVHAGAESRPIKFLPRGQPVRVPRYRLKG